MTHELTHMSASWWLTNEQLQELARTLATAVMGDDDLLFDEWLDERLRDLGCPDDQLDVWIEKVWRYPVG
jgi:hypothetical protein